MKDSIISFCQHWSGVVNCFQKLLSSWWRTALYLFANTGQEVVNCFQKLLSSWWRTAPIIFLATCKALWIAFKNYYLRDEGQQVHTPAAALYCCELLSKIIIFVMKDSLSPFSSTKAIVVNCFQKLLSSWWRTAIKTNIHCISGCELLSKIIIFVMKDSIASLIWMNILVVNCFQKLLSSWWRTASDILWYFLLQLWIAFKNYYLRDEGQPFTLGVWLLICCELLSKIIIFVMKDSRIEAECVATGVVNCFQKLLSSWWRTAQWYSMCAAELLWIAFKNYYLRDEGQQSTAKILSVDSCELLSKIIIFVMKDSESAKEKRFLKVVNCFQKLLSSWWRTARQFSQLLRRWLWIAFKNYYLRDEGQLRFRYPFDLPGCELLSKIIIFVMKDSSFNKTVLNSFVVNCFQKLLSSWWRTAISYKYTNTGVLWIAFKNYYLRDEGQLSENQRVSPPSCELLSKIIIFVMKDSCICVANTLSCVVNCFQKLLSSWWRTANSHL